MTGFLVRRLAAGLFTLWAAATLAFFALRALPGDAIAAQLATSGATPGQIAARRALLGLDQPLSRQYLDMLWGLVRADPGYSLTSGRAVRDMIAEQLPATLALAFGGLVVGALAGIGLGALMALAGKRALRLVAEGTTALLLSTPVYWLGTLLIAAFSVHLRLLPSAGSGDMRSLILPWLTLGLGLAGGIARLAAASLAQNRDADFLRTARAKGLRERAVLRRHLFRSSLGPVVALLALQMGFLLGGAVLTEMLFVRPGLGQLTLTAVQERDFPVVQAVVTLGAAVYVLAGLLADTLAAWLDPRLRAEPEHV
ncbi:MAG: ABC transporter permease [Anaerolineae bacterium]|nr:ABC transporter permease [Anaerolineae bacterium]